MPHLIVSTLLIARLSTRSSRDTFTCSRSFVLEQSMYGPMGQESSYNFLELLILRWYYMADYGFALSQRETSLQSNAVSHWLGANIEKACINHTNCTAQWFQNILFCVINHVELHGFLFWEKMIKHFKNINNTKNKTNTFRNLTLHKLIMYHGKSQTFLKANTNNV